MLRKHLNKILKYLKRALNRIYMTVKTKPRQSFEASDIMLPKALDIFVVAFNDAKLIECQYHFMQKNLRSSEYHYIICDNSNKTEAARQIFEFCRKYNITYYRLPRFLYVDPSRSHGYALNWIYRYIIRRRKKRFAFIDHDIFPIRPLQLSEYTDRPLCGVKRERHGCWYPWAAFSFYDYEFLRNKSINFMPCRYKRKHLDTGGGNYKSVYKNLADGLWRESCEHYIDIRSGKSFVWDKDVYKNRDDAVYENAVELIDEKWLHIIGGAQWGGKHDKFALAMKMFGANKQN